ncbi:TonB-dependent receptor [bacterium]|nr:TonB-dependent receptor [bacterium]
MRCFWLLMTVLLATGQAFTEGQGTIKGRVYDRATGEPVYGANVELKSDIEATGATSTDKDGSYAFEALIPGTYVLTVRFIGYRTDSHVVTVMPGGSTTRVDVNLVLGDLYGYEIVVSASRAPERLVDASATITKVTLNQIRSNAAGFTYISHLQGVKGIDYQQVGLFDERYNARGYNSAFNTRMLLLSDGRVTRTGAGNPLLNPVMSRGDLGEAEVIVGPGSALYGPDAIAGVVSLISRDPRVSSGTSVGLSVGSRRIFKGRARHAGSSGQWAWKLSGDYQRGNSWEQIATYYTPDSSFSVTDDPDFTSETLTGSASLHFYPGPASELRVSTGLTRVEQFFLNPVGRSQTRGYIHHHQQLTYEDERFYFNAYHVGDDSGDSFSLDTRALLELSGLSRQQAEEQARNSSDWSFWEAESRFTQRIGSKLTAVVGGNYRHDTSTGSVLEGGEASARLLGGYGHVETSLFDWAKVTFAARVDDHELFERQFSPKAALVLKPSEDHALRFSYNRAFKSPTLTQQRVLLPVQQGVTIRGNDAGFRFASLFGTPLPALFANGLPALQPEQSNTFEAGVRGLFIERLWVDVSAYFSRYEDFISDTIPISDIQNGIAAVGPDGLPLQEETISFTNFGEQNVQGLDVGFHYRANEMVTLRGNLSVIDTDELKNANGLSQPFNSPEVTLNLGATIIDFLVKRSRLDFGMKYVSEHAFVSGIHKGIVPAYTIFNFGASLGRDNGIGYRLTIRNLFNNKHREFVTGPEIGAVVVGEVEVGF